MGESKSGTPLLQQLRPQTLGPRHYPPPPLPLLDGCVLLAGCVPTVAQEEGSPQAPHPVVQTKRLERLSDVTPSTRKCL